MHVALEVDRRERREPRQSCRRIRRRLKKSYCCRKCVTHHQRGVTSSCSIIRREAHVEVAVVPLEHALLGIATAPRVLDVLILGRDNILAFARAGLHVDSAVFLGWPTGLKVHMQAAAHEKAGHQLTAATA